MRTCSMIFSSLLFAILIQNPAFSAPAEGIFRASALKINVTPNHPVWLKGYPPIGNFRAKPSTEVHDSIYLRIVCLDDGLNQIFLISSDHHSIPGDYFAQFCNELKKKTGIRPEQVTWSATHTHSSPAVGPKSPYNQEENKEYSAWLKEIAIESVKKARESLVPAKLGYISSIALANMNRRALYPDRLYLGKNPNGLIDRQLGVIKIEKPDGSLLALIVNYAMHSTSMFASNEQISGDASGIAATYVEEKLGAPMLYVPGASGNQAPLYETRDKFIEDNHFNIYQFQKLLGDPILLTQKMITTTPDVTLQTGSTVITCPRNKKWYKGEEPVVKVPVQFIRINDLMIYSAPLELFCEIDMNIRDASPFPETFFFGYSNGYLLYLTTKRAFSEGGYEVWPTSTPFDESGEKLFYDAVTAYINRMYAK